MHSQLRLAIPAVVRHAGAVAALVLLVACGGDGDGITTPSRVLVPDKNTLGPVLATGTDAATGASLTTNQDDYVPGEVVHLSGAGWAPGETIHLDMSEVPDTHPDVTMDVTADSAGSFSIHFYDVQQHDANVTFTLVGTGVTSGSAVTVVFTDNVPLVNAWLNGVAAVTVAPNTIITARDTGVVNSGGSNKSLTSTGAKIMQGATLIAAYCLDVTDIVVSTGAVNWAFSFPIVAPATPGTYDVVFGTYGLTGTPPSVPNNTCTGTPLTTLTLVGGITVASANSAPTLTVASTSVNEGSPLSLTATATDPDAGQTLAFSLIGAPAGMTIGSTSGVFSWTPTDGPAQTATFTVRVTDNGAGNLFDEETITVTVVNVAPTATFTAPSSVVEGSDIDLSLTLPYDPSSVDVAAGFTYDFDCGTGYSGTFTSTSTKACSTTDDDARTVKGQVKDKDGGVTEYTASVTVDNVDPSITTFTYPTAPIATTTPVVVNWAFTDPGADTWTCSIQWDAALSFESASYVPTRSCAASKPLGPGIYTVTVKVEDDDGGVGTRTATEYIVVYDPNGGFVTGGGWITSPAGAYVANASLTGKATFGFVSRYKKGATTPQGNTEFQFQMASFNFSSTSYEWLVVSGARAQYKGSGTINGSGNYGFMLSAIDGQVSGGGDTDKFRIKIWNKTTGDTIYDNQMGATDTDPITTVLGGGSIVIH